MINLNTKEKLEIILRSERIEFYCQELNYKIEEIIMKIKWIDIWKWRKNYENLKNWIMKLKK